MTSVGGLGEFGLIDRIRPHLGGQAGEDDAAVLSDGPGFLIVSTDTFVENVHFDLGWMTAADAGWRALALALGDLAAKGATPAWALSSIALPARWTIEDLESLYGGMSELAREESIEIVGGDMSSIDGPAVLSLTVAGHTQTRPILRSQAQAGWSVAVTGPLGGAAVALRERRAPRLRPRLQEGRRLNQAGLCCGDVSDGLLREMQKFAHMAGTGCRLEAEAVERAAGATLQEALTSGEEAELVCAGPDGLIRKAGLRPVGVLTAERWVEVVDAVGRPLQLAHGGYDHFA